jgi:nicotinamidase-related amidase
MKKGKMLNPGECCLHIVDPQQTLLKNIPDADQIIRVIKLMISCAEIMNIPIIANIQYKKGLGPYHPELENVLAHTDIIDKREFGALANDQTVEAVQALPEKVTTHILVGIETHICIYQTAMGLLEADRKPWIVVDGVSARGVKNHTFGLARMGALGMDMGPVEMVVYELLGKAGTPEFKKVLPHIRAFSEAG